MKALVNIGGAVILLLLVPPAGRANFGLLRWWSSYREYPPPVTTYYVPVTPVYVPYAWPSPPPVAVAPPLRPAPATPLPSSPRPLLARPTPAPPSDTPEPPRAEPMPKAGVSSESRKVNAPSFDAYYVGRPGAAAVSDRCAVVFWNLSERPVVLTVEGRAFRLAPRANVRLDLGRAFTWDVAGREPQRQQVPDDESGLEVVIRGG